MLRSSWLMWSPKLILIRLHLPFELSKVWTVFPSLRAIRYFCRLLTHEFLIATLGAIILWVLLYYELFYVALVCPYYTGDELSPYLNQFHTVGRTYRPTIYLFPAKLQWLYLNTFCKLLRCYNYVLISASTAGTDICSRLKNIYGKSVLWILNSFLYRHLFRGQARVTIREFVEGNNGSLVVLDYYLPKWLGSYCPKCGKYRDENVNPPKERFGLTKSQLPEDSQPSKSRVPATNGDKPPANRISDICNLVSRKFVDIDSDIRVVKSALDKEVTDEPSPRPNPTTEPKFINTDPLPRKILRGVIAIVGDLNVAYSICNQDFNCRCGVITVDIDDHRCGGCESTFLDNSLGLNSVPASIPTVRYFINDALEQGFACVQVHLNVNLGMAGEAFPSWPGLRSFPITLYSDVRLDLDHALKHIGVRYPNLPLSCVGVGYGGNVLMEYLALGCANKSLLTSLDSSTSSLNDIQRNAIFPGRRVSSRTDDKNESTDTDDNSSRSDSMLRSRAVKVLNEKKPLQQHGNKAERTTTKVTKVIPPVPSMNDANYEPFMYLNKVMREINMTPGHKIAPRSSGGNIIVQPKDDHFHVPEESEECTYETTMVYPPPTPVETVFDTKRISSVVCINLNLCTRGNVYYKNGPTRDVPNSSCYVRYCHDTLRDHLIAMIREVHCTKRRDKRSKICQRYKCCHYTRRLYSRSISQRFWHTIASTTDGFRRYFRGHSIDELLLCLHREYRNSHREMTKRGSREYVNYGNHVFNRFGARTSPGFKLCALMTLRYVYSNVGHDGRNRIETISGEPKYNLVNKKVDMDLRLGHGHLHKSMRRILNSGTNRSQDGRICRYIGELINREYINNAVNIRRNFETISVPTLLLSSLDNSVFGHEDVDIFDVIKNPNIVHYLSNSGGYSTFLSGIYPVPWFSVPVLEFIDEMFNRRALM
ncbi:putative integral membrane protein [Babesia bovis T2Bo]|uniref:putative integral membrane protein n=1 Tax=Babesia bovis T2Bo TaxID=484906 RepID=UPI001C344787|nr:putative integral membrane protein [Babesia bovis T2Bo]EDO08474.2 putative integral membrane protein [Babesia bovis T2Bo]